MENERIADIEHLQKLKEEEKQLDEKLSQLKQMASDKKKVMDALHEYNDIKDATQVVLGQLACLYGTTTIELHRKFDLPTED